MWGSLSPPAFPKLELQVDYLSSLEPLDSRRLQASPCPELRLDLALLISMHHCDLCELDWNAPRAKAGVLLRAGVCPGEACGLWCLEGCGYNSVGEFMLGQLIQNACTYGVFAALTITHSLRRSQKIPQVNMVSRLRKALIDVTEDDALIRMRTEKTSTELHNLTRQSEMHTTERLDSVTKAQDASTSVWPCFYGDFTWLGCCGQANMLHMHMHASNIQRRHRHHHAIIMLTFAKKARQPQHILLCTQTSFVSRCRQSQFTIKDTHLCSPSSETSWRLTPSDHVFGSSQSRCTSGVSCLCGRWWSCLCCVEPNILHPGVIAGPKKCVTALPGALVTKLLFSSAWQMWLSILAMACMVTVLVTRGAPFSNIGRKLVVSFRFRHHAPRIREFLGKGWAENCVLRLTSWSSWWSLSFCNSEVCVREHQV